MKLGKDSHGRSTTFYRMGLGDRAAELLVFLHLRYPMDQDAEIEWVDVNPSLGRCTHSGKPWRHVCPTMTGASQMSVRYVKGNEIILRPQSGLESFALMGWHITYFAPLCCWTESLLKNMAGNAFSGFAITPMLMLAIGGHSLVQSARAASAQEQACDDVMQEFCSGDEVSSD